MPCSVDFSGKSALLWREKEEECIWGRGSCGGLGRGDGGEPAVSMYCMREEQFFSKDINEKKGEKQEEPLGRCLSVLLLNKYYSTLLPYMDSKPTEK